MTRDSANTPHLKVLTGSHAMQTSCKNITRNVYILLIRRYICHRLCQEETLKYRFWNKYGTSLDLNLLHIYTCILCHQHTTDS